MPVNNPKMKRLLTKYTLLGGLALASFGCSDFEKINTNPNAATSVTPEMLATNLILNITGVSFTTPALLAKQINHTEFPNAMQYNNLGRHNYEGLVVLTNVEKMIASAPEGPMKNTFTGLGKFVRAWRFYETTMRVGDIPYHEALQGEKGLIAPAYDTQKEVFLGILQELEEADQALAQGANFTGDPIYNGNVTLWRKAVNTFALKVLLTLSSKEGDSDLNVKSRFASIVANKPLISSNDENFQRVYRDAAGMRFPWYYLGNQGLIYIVLSSVVVDKLKELEDYRLFYYAAPSPVRLENGAKRSDWTAYRGVNPSVVYNELTAVAASRDYSNFNSRYSDLADCEPIYHLGYNTLQFTLAEAALRGWITGTTASQYYENGIRASMEFTAKYTPDNEKYNNGRLITPAYINSYLEKEDVKLSGTFDQQLEQIMTQRYLGTFMQAGFDSYFEYRRTGYPVLPVNPASNNNTVADKIPVRWMYPSSEVNYNTENLNKALQSQYGGNDDFNEKMWLLK